MTNERVLPSPTPPGIDKSQISCVSVYVTCVVGLAPLAGSRLAWSQRPHDRPRRGFTGLWELFVPFGRAPADVPEGSNYGYQILTIHGPPISHYGHRGHVVAI